MANKKGATKVGGRAKGTPNALVKTAREIFKDTLEAQVPNIQAAFEQVRQDDPAKYLELFAKYAQYFVPKQLDIDIHSKIITVEIKEE